MLYVHDRQGRMDSWMRLPVANQARLLRERLTADITDIRPFARVDEQVLPVSRSTRESFAAYVAIVRPVPGVSHHMLFQSMILGERLPTLLAHEALPSLVLQQNMLVEVLLRHHSPLAYLALVLWFEMRPLLVHVQGIAVRACLPAHVAHDRALLVLESHVKPHVAFHLELLPAILAVVLVLRRVFPLQVFLQSAPILTLELAHVARVLFRLARVPVTAFPPPYTFRRVFPADVGMKGGLVGALVVAVVARIGQTLGIFHLLLLLRLVLQSHVHLERDQATAYLETDFALVSLCLLVDRVPVPFQHLHHREADVALLAGVSFRVVVIVLVRRRNLVHVLLLYFDRAQIAVDRFLLGRDHECLLPLAVLRTIIVRRLRSLPFGELWRLTRWKEGIVEATFYVDNLPRLHWNRFLAVYKTSIPV